MKLKEKITIVIPCKNEQGYLPNLIVDISRQSDIRGTRIIIADAQSTDGTRHRVQMQQMVFKNHLDIQIIEGGHVSVGRNRGLDLVETPYTVFIDADVRLTHIDQLKATAKLLKSHTLIGAGLRGTNFKSTLAYTAFNIVNAVISNFRPFAVGSFFATHTDKIRALGKWDETLVHSEDWELSGKYSPLEYTLCPHPIKVDDRRFKKQGYLGMAKMLLTSLLRGTPYRRQDNGYWD